MRGFDSTMANETNNNLSPEQMAARIAELEGRLAKGSSLSFNRRFLISLEAGIVGRSALSV
jgi:hypothetical protein